METRVGQLGRRLECGVSLTELLVVVTVLAIITAIAVPTFSNVHSNSKNVVAGEVMETLNMGLKKHAQVNYEFSLAADNAATDDEFAILRSLQWRDPLDPATGAPFVRPNWNPSASTEAKDYRLRWKGRTFDVLQPGDAGSGIKVDFEAGDYGENYNFPDDFSPVGG